MKRLFSLEQYLLIGGIGVLLIAILLPFLQAILLGLFIALLLYPLYTKAQRATGLPRPLAALLFTLIFSVLVVLPLTLLGLSLVSDASDLFTRVRNEGPVWLENFMLIPWVQEARRIGESFLGSGNSVNLNEKALQALAVVGGGAIDFIALLVSKLPVFLLDVGIFLLTLFFGFLDGPRLVNLLREILPFTPPTTEELFQTGDNICRGVMLGTVVVSAAQALLIGLGYWITGISNPLFFAAVTAVLSVLPLVGSAPIGFGGVVYLLITQNYGLAVVMLIFALASTLSDNILKPLVLKGYSSIHPLLGILSVLGGLALFGFLGIFLGPLIAALVLVVLKVMIHAQKAEALPS